MRENKQANISSDRAVKTETLKENRSALRFDTYMVSDARFTLLGTMIQRAFEEGKSVLVGAHRQFLRETARRESEKRFEKDHARTYVY